MDRVNIVHQNLLDRVSAENFPSGKDDFKALQEQNSLLISMGVEAQRKFVI